MDWRGKAVAAAVVAGFVALQWGERPTLPVLGDQMAHALLYYILALTLWLVLPARDRLARAAVVVSVGLLVAVVMESGQAHFGDRRPDTADVMADLLGLLMAALPLAWGGGQPAEPKAA